jgi:hypothetical protein
VFFCSSLAGYCNQFYSHRLTGCQEPSPVQRFWR